MTNEELDKKYEDLEVILYSSKEFNFKKSHVLVIREYYGNREVELDLSKIDKEMFEKLYYDSEKELDDDYEY